MKPIKTLAPNQLVIETENGKFFQSYDTIICRIDESGNVFLDSEKYDYSKTTAKYRNIFLGEDTKTTEKKIKEGIYKLTNLNL